MVQSSAYRQYISEELNFGPFVRQIFLTIRGKVRLYNKLEPLGFHESSYAVILSQIASFLFSFPPSFLIGLIYVSMSMNWQYVSMHATSNVFVSVGHLFVCLSVCKII